MTDSRGGPGPLIVSVPPTYVAERRYIVRLILGEWLGLEFETASGDVPGVTVRRAHDPHGRVLSVREGLFSCPEADWLTERSMPVPPLRTVALPPAAGEDAGRGGSVLDAGRLESVPDAGPRGSVPDAGTSRTVPVLFGEAATDGTPWRPTPEGIELTIDVFGTAFFMLGRVEEIVRAARDEHGRFASPASLAGAAGFLGRPIVDDHVEILWSAMRALWPDLERRPTSFRLRPTHDVDFASAALGMPASPVAREVARDLVRRRDPWLGLRRGLALIASRAGRVALDPFDTFDFLMDTSERHGLRSTFYFMAGIGRPFKNAPYRPNERYITRVLDRIHRRGHEVGLHASYDSFRSAERMRAELEALQSACRMAGFEQPTWGVRQHFLRFENPVTWREQAAVGFEHDSTLGFADEVGFRAGTCREFPVFDLLERRELGLRERPLVVMDGTLFSYLGLGLDEAAAHARAVVEQCRERRGDAVLLYHNSALTGPRERAHYRELIEDLARPT